MKPKNFTLKIFTALTLVLMAFAAHAQVQQTIIIGSAEYTSDHDYAVDTEENGNPQPNGTVGSTYAWSIVEGVGAFPPAGAQNTNLNDNKATINWNGVAAGIYTIRAVETNAGCPPIPVEFEVEIEAPGNPILVWADAPTAICVGEDATFNITGAIPNSTITYTAIGATLGGGTVTVDGSGNGTIILTHDGTATQISVTLTLMNGVTINVGPITAQVNIVQTSPIQLLP